MLWIHPLFQFMTAILSLYVLSLGFVRFKANHFSFKSNTAFPWQEHVKYGKFVHIFWMSGLVLGLYVVGSTWGQNGITATHYWVGQSMMLCIGGGYATGWFMDNNKQERRYLPIAHAIFNTMAVFLALIQMGTGFMVIREFLL